MSIPPPTRRPRPRWPVVGLLTLVAATATSTLAWSASEREFEEAVAAHHGGPLPAASAPTLGPWPSLAVLPQAWGDVACAAPVADGCAAYAGTVHVAGGPHHVAAAAVRHLRRAGYRVDVASCARAGPWHLAAYRARASGALYVGIAISARSSAGGTRVSVDVGDRAATAPAAATSPA